MKKIIILSIAIELVCTCFAVTPGFQGIGDLAGTSPNFKSRAFDISANGTVVVGMGRAVSGSGRNEAFIWTSVDGMVALGDLRSGLFQSSASGVSADGAVVVGSGNSFSGTEAFRWTAEEGMVGLGDLPGGLFSSNATDVSADGSVIVGKGASPLSGYEAYRWTPTDGMVGLGDFPSNRFQSYASGVSADGSVVVGNGNSASGREAFRWTAATGMVGLGDLQGGSFHSNANDVSASGLVIIGQSFSDSGLEAFRWTADEGMVGLGDLPGGLFASLAMGVSADGSIIVGQGSSTLGHEAFYWTANGGMRNLKDILTQFGFDLNGWQLYDARAVSSDGLTIVGYGMNPSGGDEAWIAVIPEPPLNTAPIANAGEDKVVYAWIDGLAEVQLDGTDSYDDDGDALEYFWFVYSNEIAIGAEPNVVFGVGEYEVTLIVNDSIVDSEPNSCMITVLPAIETQISTRPRVVLMAKLPLDMFVKMKLPAGIEAFDLETPMTLEPWGIEAYDQSLVTRGKNTLVFAYFVLDEILEFTASPMAITVVGQLQSGEYIYGTDSIKLH